MLSMILVMIVLSVLLAWGITGWIQHRAVMLHLMQKPNARSSHIQPTPNGGGLGIVVAGSLVGIGLTVFAGWVLGWVVLGLALLLAVVGLRDDIQPLSARLRLVVQVAVCMGLLFALGDVPSISFADTGAFVLDGWVLTGLLLLAGVWWINLYNFMDGIDGIAGVQAVFMLLSAAVLSALVHPESMPSPIWMFMLCVVSATLGFLLLNWPPAKIFMGDVGSTWLAFIVFALALLSIQLGWLSYATWLVLAAVFVTDATVTLLTRMLSGEHWYQPHRNHTYQKFARRWHAHRPVTLLAIGINVLWLIPVAGACVVWSQWVLGWVLLAYAPLVVGAVVLGAGKSDV